MCVETASEQMFVGEGPRGEVVMAELVVVCFVELMLDVCGVCWRMEILSQGFPDSAT